MLQKREGEAKELVSGLQQSFTERRKLIFLDETIFQARDNSIWAWATPNEEIEFSGVFTRSVTMIAVIDDDGVFYYELFFRAVGGQQLVCRR